MSILISYFTSVQTWVHWRTAHAFFTKWHNNDKMFFFNLFRFPGNRSLASSEMEADSPTSWEEEADKELSPSSSNHNPNWRLEERFLMASTATKMATGQMVDHSHGHGQRNHSTCERDRERIKLDTIRLNDNYEVEELFIKEWLYWGQKVKWGHIISCL